MARPTQKQVKKDPNFKECPICSRSLLRKPNFYQTETPMFADGVVPICKACIKIEVNEGGLEAVQRILRQIDKPLIMGVWNSAVTSGKEPFGWYIRQINSLGQYKGLGYADSSGAELFKKSPLLIESKEDEEEDELYDKPTLEVKRKWGAGYSNKEYYDLEKTWDDMMRANAIETPQHETNLELYCQLKIKVKRALENDDNNAFKVLNKEFQEVSKNSGFRPIDKLSGSESAGIRSFSAIFEEVEKDGFIEPYPLEFNQDIVDKTIMYLSNYTRKLLQMEQLIEPQDDTPQMYEDGDE